MYLGINVGIQALMWIMPPAASSAYRARLLSALAYKDCRCRDPPRREIRGANRYL